MMKPTVLLIAIIIFSLTGNISYVHGQGGDEIFTVVEEMPQFPGGQNALNTFIMTNLKYPQQDVVKGTEGTVYVSFIVEASGAVSNVSILRGLSEGCDEEVVRVIKLMPSWSPGKQRNKAVRVKMHLPVKFSLND